jgi:CheY-like chemotaxis protein
MKETDRNKIRIVMADDDVDDRLLLKEALDEVRLGNAIDFAVNGEDLMDYLKRRGEYGKLSDMPLPGLILLDLNMPRMDGRQVLRTIKSDPKLRYIPVVILTHSQAEEDVLRSYDLGVNSFIVKPVTFEKLVKVVKSITNYWFEIVRVPVVS